MPAASPHEAGASGDAAAPAAAAPSAADGARAPPASLSWMAGHQPLSAAARPAPPAPSPVPAVWPRPLVEPDYCPVHCAHVIAASGGGAAAAAAAAAAASRSDGSGSGGSGSNGVGGASDAGSGGASATAAPAALTDGEGGGAAHGGARLARYLQLRDREALAAMVVANGGGWYRHIGGSCADGVNEIISEGVRRGAGPDGALAPRRTEGDEESGGEGPEGGGGGGEGLG